MSLESLFHQDESRIWTPNRGNRPGSKEARRMFESFHDFKPNGVSQIDLDLEGDLVLLGRAHEIKYLSDKWHKKEEGYVHEFSPETYLFTNEPGNLLIIWGEKLRVKSTGINN